METFFFADENFPYLFSACILASLLVLEILSIMVGLSTSLHGDIDLSADLDGNGIPDYLEADGSVFDWANPSHVPLMIFVILFACTFSVIGFTGQWVFEGFTGHLIPVLIGLPVTLALTLALTRYTSAGVAAIMPKDITTAVSTDSLIGKVGVVNVGPVTKSEMGKARFTDIHGTDHNLFIVSVDDESIALDEQVLLLGMSSLNDFTYEVRKI